MDLLYSTGNEIVDKVSEMNFTGNVVPIAWFKTMINETGKPMLLAINLLSDIVYWYRPKEIRDEKTGELLGFKKRFKADFLQRSYRQIEQRFGVTKRQARFALDYLCDMGLIKKHLRDEVASDGTPIYNSMYLELIPEKLREITYPHSIEGGVPLMSPPCAIDVTTLCHSCNHRGYMEGTTNTEITTESSTKEYNNPIYLDMVEDGMKDDYVSLIKKQIDYDYLMHDSEGRDKCYLDEIVNLLVDTIYVKRKYITIGGCKLTQEQVVMQLKKLNSTHIGYVLDSMSENTTKIKNMRNYLLTVLYNAPNTVDFHYRSMVNYNTYGKEND